MRTAAITPLIPATWTGGDRGQPLPGQLRAWLERRLDADLGAVRVHDDDATRAATTAAGALALTCGVHIALGVRAPEWRTADGHELLAHEAIHVLQQTAVRGSDGRLAATDRSGGGDPQAAPDLDIGTELAGVFAPAPTLDELLDGYTGAFSQDGDLLVTASRMYAGEMLGVDVGKAATVRSAALIADAFKLRSDWSSARQILAAHRALPTGYRDLAFYRHIVAKAPELFGEAAAIGYAQIVAPVITAIRTWLLSPDLTLDHLAASVPWALPPLATGEVGPSEIWAGAARAAQAAGELLRNELTARYARLEDETKDGAPIGAMRDEIDLRVLLAAAITKSKGAIAKAKVAEVRAVLGVLAPGLVAAGNDATAVWKRSRATVSAEVSTDLNARGIDVTIAAAVETVLRAAAAPSGVDFETVVATAEAALWTAAAPLSAALTAQDTKALDRTDSQAAGVALATITRLVHILRTFNSARDRRLVAASLYDARIAVGVELAREAERLGDRSGALWLLLDAGQTFLKTSHLAITGDWKEVVSDRGDFDSEMGRRGGSLAPIGLPWWVLDRAAYITYDLELAHQLELAAVTTLPGQSARAEARRAAQRTGRPRRFVAPAVFWNREPDSVGRFGATVSGGSTLVMHHPLAAAQVEKLRGGDDVLWAVPAQEPGARSEVVVWILPDLASLVDRLALVPGLHDRVMKRWRTTHASGEPGPWHWLQTLLDVAESLPKDSQKGVYDRAELAHAVRTHIETESAAAISERERAMLHATSFDREQLVASLASRLRSYDRTDRATLPRIEAFGAELQTFLGGVEPRRDRPVHAAAVALALAPTLVAAVGGSHIDTDYPVVANLTPLVVGAMALWDDRSGQAQILAAAPDGGGQAHVESLAATLRPFAAAYGRYVDRVDRSDGFIAEKDARLHHVKGNAGAFEVGGSYQVGSKRPGARKQKPADQIRLSLVAVHESFTYHAGMRVRDLGAAWPADLVVPGRTRLLDANGNPWQSKHTKLVTYTIGGKKVEVHDDEPDELALLDEMVGRWFFIGTMANAQAAIEWAFNAALDLAEFIPGIGQGITLARFGVALLDFIANDLPAVSEALGGFSFDGLWRSVDALVVRPELMLLRFLDADLDFQPKVPHVDDRAEPIRQRTGPWARLARFIGRIYQLAASVGRKLAALQPVVVAPLHALEGQIASHHGAAVLAYLVEEFGDRLSSVTDLAAVLDSPDGLADLTADLVDGATEWVGTVLHAVDGLRAFSMPAKLFDMTVIVDIVVEIVLQQLGGKAEAIARGSRAILDAIGLWDDVLAEVTSVITSFAGDPNDVFTAAIQGPLSALLEGVRSAVVGAVGRGLSELPVLTGVAALTSPSLGDPLVVELDPDEEIEAMPAPGGVASPAQAALGGELPGGTTRGARLAPPVRQWAERVLGHDVGHVRAHQDGAADTIVRGAGALAVTTGSHVLLRSDIDVSTRAGAGVLAHELTHVVQQTGSRPLGATHSDTAIAGARRGGLLVDAGREAEADAAARRVGTGAGAPLAVGAATGVQPTLGPFLRRFVGHLRRTDLVRERAKGYTDDTVSAADRKLASALVTKLLTLITGSTSTWKPTFRAGRKTIETYLGGKRDLLVVAAANAVEEARTLVTPKKGKPVPHVRPGVLRAVLIDALFGLTGIGVELTMGTKRGSGVLDRRTVLDDDAPFSAVEIKFVHLGFIGSGSGVWKAVMDASFGPTRYRGLYTEDQYRTAARLLLERRGVQLRIWDRAAFQFSKTFIAEVDDWLRQGELPAELLPSPKDYLETTAGAVPDVPDHGQIGLRLGLYKDRKADADKTGGDGSQKGTGRASHHLTQWLVVDFLANQNSAKLFAAGSTKAVFPFDPPPEFGLTATSSGRITAMRDGSDSIDIQTLATSRGADMAAILISRHAHQRGHAHIDPVEPDQGGARRQGNHLVDLMREAANKQGLPRTGIELDDLKPAAKQQLPAKFFAAARTTYRGASRITLDALRDTVFVAERRYYNTLAEEAGRADRIDESQTDAVHAKAVAFNNAALAKWGLK